MSDMTFPSTMKLPVEENVPISLELLGVNVAFHIMSVPSSIVGVLSPFWRTDQVAPLFNE